MFPVFKLAAFLSILVLVGCIHIGENDYSSFSDLADDIQNDIRGEKNIPHRGLMFLYKGPWGWSDPEYRFTVDIEKDFSVDFLKLEEQSITQASELWDSGIRTYEEMKLNLKTNGFRLNITSCSEIPPLTNDLWQSVVSYSSSFNHTERKRVILDGGYSFNFYLSDGDYNKLMYRVVDHDHPLTIQAFEFIERLKACDKIVKNELKRSLGQIR